MPMVAAAAVAVFGAVSAGAAVATAIGVTSFLGLSVATWSAIGMVGMAVSALALGLSMSSMMPKPSSTGTQLNMKLTGNDPLPVVYGRTATGGTIVYRETFGKSNETLAMIVALSVGGSIAGFDGVLANDYTLGLSGSVGSVQTVNAVSGHTYKSKMFTHGGKFRMARRVGATPETQTPSQYAGVTLPKSPGKLSGIAHAVMLMDYSQNTFPQGVPKVVHIVRGQRVYDPRLDDTYPGGEGDHRIDDPDTWEFSENPHLCALNWTLGRFENDVLVYGIGATPAEVDLSAFVAGANIADELGWKVGGVVQTTDDKFAVLGTLLQAGGAVPVARGAQISCVTNTARSSIFSITPEHVIGSAEIINSTAFRDRKNHITPRYRAESQFWQITNGEPVTASTYVEEDGGELRSTEAEYPFVQDATQAHQLAAYDLVNGREFLQLDLTTKPELMAVRAGDCVTVTLPDLALDDQKFIVVARDFDPATWTVKLSLRAETDAKHAFALGQTAEAPASPALKTFDPSNPEPPGEDAWVVTETSISTGSGSNAVTSPAIVIEGESDEPTATQVLLEWRRPLVFEGEAPSADEQAEMGWLGEVAIDASATRGEITAGLLPATDYEVGISYRTVIGVKSQRLILGPITTGEQRVAAVTDGGIDWAANTIANVPGGLATNESGQLLANNVATANGVTVEFALANVIVDVSEIAGMIADIESGVNTAYQEAQDSANGAADAASWAFANAALIDAARIEAEDFRDYAAANATATQAAASQAMANAITAQAAATQAGSNASLAAAMATFAISNATASAANAAASLASAVDAQVKAGWANANAIVANTQAIYASANSAAAQTSASTAATQAGYAGANSAAAQSSATLAATYSGYAGANASAAATQAGYSASNATISTAQAGFASSNASYAASNATLSATFAGYANSNSTAAATQAGYSASNAAISTTQAGYSTSNAAFAASNATLSATRAGYAQTNATVAQTQAGYATANAALATSNATLAATFAGYANSNSTAAATQAGYSAANATLATTQAGYSTSNAAFAASNATLSATRAGYAQTNATVSTTQAGYASANAALATSNATLAASHAANSNVAANIATTQAGYATANAALVFSNVALAASYAANAVSTVSTTLPSTFEGGLGFWTETPGGSTASVATMANGTLQSVTTIGQTWRATGYQPLHTKGVVPVTSGRSYRLSAKFRQFSDPTTGGSIAGFGFIPLDADFRQQGPIIPARTSAGSSSVVALAAAQGWQTVSGSFAESATRTNYWLNSATGTSWALTGLNTPTATTAIGGNAAWLFTVSGAGSLGYVTGDSIAVQAGEAVTFTVYLRGTAANSTFVLGIDGSVDGFGDDDLIFHNTDIGTVAPTLSGGLVTVAAVPTSTSASIVNRVRITRYSTVAQTVTPRVYLKSAVAGDIVGTETGHIAGPQFEIGDTASPYLISAATASTQTIQTLSRTNRQPYSQDLDQWTKFLCTVSAAAATAPDGTMTACRLTDTSAGSGDIYITRLNNFTVNAGRAYTISGYAKYESCPVLQVYGGHGFSLFSANFDLANGVVGSKGAGATSHSITAVGDGWYRWSLTGAAATSAIAISEIYLQQQLSPTAAAGANVVGAGRSFLLWGIQVEENAFASPYIPTGATAVTVNDPPAYLRPVIFGNYGSTNGDGAFEVAYLRFEDVTESTAANTSVTLATTQAGYANANAALATSNATLSATFAGYAAANAGLAATSAGYSASNATISTTQAGFANSNAALATSNATLAATFSGYAAANAGLAATSAGYSASNATISTTQAGFAGSNAALASSNATLSATFAGYAAANAAAASTQAGYSAANATISTTQAGFATSNAALATSNATLSATFAGYAAANAGLAATSAGYSASNATISTTQAGFASANASLATSNATLSATFAGYAAANAAAASTQAGYSAANATISTAQAGFANSNAALATSNATLAATYSGYAAANATTAQTAAGYSASNATISTTQAGFANDNASMAASNATLAATFAGYANDNAAVAVSNATLAGTLAGYSAANAALATTQAGYANANAAFAASNATLSATRAGYAEANATVAQTQAGFATSNAALATSNASLAATFAGYALANSTASQTQAGYSAANATIATTQAGYSTSNAAFAASNATLSATRAGFAQTNATVAQTQAGFATSNAALATSNATLSATFAGYSNSNATLAATRAGYAQSNVTLATTQAGYASANAAFAASNATLAATFSGFSNSNATLATTQAGYATSNAALVFSNVALAAGHAANASNASAFAASNATLSQTRATYAAANVALAQNWSNVAASHAANAIANGAALQASINAVTAAWTSNAAAQALSLTTLTANLAGANASLTTQAGAISTLQGKTAAYLDIVAAAGADPAYLRMNATSYGSNIMLAASAIGLYNTGGSGLKKVMEIIGGNARFSTPVEIQVGSSKLVLGPNFGTSSNLVMWFGSNMALSAMTTANSTFHLKNDGSAYFGGTLSAGILRNGGEASGLSATQEFILGPFGTNGDTKTVTVSWRYTIYGSRDTNPSTRTDTVAATVTLFRSIAGSAYTQVATQSVSAGGATWTVEEYGDAVDAPNPLGGNNGFLDYSFEGAKSITFTFTDTNTSTGDFTYKAVLSRSGSFTPGGTLLPSPYTIYDQNTQRLGIVSVEQ